MEVYWIDLGEAPLHLGLGLGVGVTAKNIDDAVALIEEEFGSQTVTRITVVENVDQLEVNHVRPNMGDFLRRGIWFPNISGWSP